MISRSFHSIARMTEIKCAPFSRAVINGMRNLYPEGLAEKSWDNTGLLLEAPFNPVRRQAHSVLLTIDLTAAVAEEAIKRKDSIIIAYHPIIFRGLKSLTLNNSQQKSLLRLAAEGISVYSPHTALDNASNGINHWLGNIITQVLDNSSPTTETTSQEKRPLYNLSHFVPPESIPRENHVPHQSEVIKPLESLVNGQEEAGRGRIVRFDKPSSLQEIIERISHGLGSPKGLFSVAIPQKKEFKDIFITSVGICAGSGGSLLNPLKNMDLLFTGELSHHEALAAIENGQVVITVGHSNSERGYLGGVLKPQLTRQITAEWTKLVQEAEESNDNDSVWKEREFEVAISQADRDPFGTVYLV